MDGTRKPGLILRCFKYSSLWKIELKIKLLFFISLLMVAFQLLVSFPMTIWLQNKFSFGVELVNAISLVGIVFCGVSLFLFLVALLTPEKIRTYLLPLFVLVSVLLYLQQNILVWDYGFLDGKHFDFDNNNYLGLIDLLIWVVGILAFTLYRKQVTKWAGTILLFVGLMTVLATANTLFSLDFDKDSAPGTISDLDKFSYSDKENVLLFILDGFQSDLFWDLIDNEPGLINEFAGFTFYPNTSSVFAKTYPTIPLLLTGRVYTKQQTFEEFLPQTYEKSLLTSLIERGWDVGLYPRIKSTVSVNDSIMSNYVELLGWDEKVDNYLLALDLSLFRAAPHFTKSLVYNDGDFILQKTLGEHLDSISKPLEQRSLPRHHVHEGLNFLKNLQASGNTKTREPTFRFYHLNMPHKPFLLDRDLNYGLRMDGFSSYREYAYASVKLMIKYLEELKRLGVYDNSSIIITADHGAGEHTSNKYISAEKQYVVISEDGREKASGKPLLLIKRHHDNSPFQLSSKPVSLLDIAPTIASFTSISKGSFKGLPVDEITVGGSRSRTYYHYNFTGFDSKYLSDFYTYHIEGDVYDETAWKKGSKITGPKFKNDQEKYVLNSVVTYGTDEKSGTDFMNAFLVGDNYKIKPSQIVSSSGELDLSLILERSLTEGEVYLLELDVAALNDSSGVAIQLDSRDIPPPVFKNETKKKLIFLDPGNIKSKDKLDIHLESLAVSGAGGPISLSELNFRPAQLATFGKNSYIRFSENLEAYHLVGFGAPDLSGRWSSNTESAFHFLAEDDFCRDSFIHLKTGKFYTGVSPDRFTVHLNGEMLEPVRLDKSNNKITYIYECKPNQLNDLGVNRLTFNTDKVVSPSSLGSSTDTRELGVVFLELKLKDKLQTSAN